MKSHHRRHASVQHLARTEIQCTYSADAPTRTVGRVTMNCGRSMYGKERLSVRNVRLSEKKNSSFEWQQILNATGVPPSKRAFAAGGIYPGSSLFYVGLGWDVDGGYQSDVHMIDVNQLKWVQRKEVQLKHFLFVTLQ